MKKFIVVLLFLSGITIGCGPQGVLFDYQDTEIVFGSGGGFTGQINEYHLDAKGNLKMVESLSGSQTNLGKIKKSDLQKIYKTLSELNLSNMNFNQPGNISYFIREINKTNTYEVIWGNPDQQVPQNIQAFYDSLIASMN